jgi:GUN4-like/TIR domain
MENPTGFDVFLCHNSEDKPEVEQIAHQLKAIGLEPWLDKWELPPGRPWRRMLEEQIGQVRSAAVFVGSNGRGPWQELEIDALLNEFARRQCPVIPVLLHNASVQPDLPLFLKGMGWVDFRRQDSDPLKQLRWGITGQKPDFSIDQDKSDGSSNNAILSQNHSAHGAREVSLTELERLLSLGQWKEADQQTKEIILALNDDKKLAVQDIRKLSPELLHKIDALWSRFSDGRFGLRVQKQIWQQSLKNPKILGFFASSKPVDDSEVLIRFGEAVGWREKGIDRWFGHGDLDFSTQSPIGCFPYTRRWLNAGWNKAPQQFSTLMLSLRNLP